MDVKLLAENHYRTDKNMLEDSINDVKQRRIGFIAGHNSRNEEVEELVESLEKLSVLLDKVTSPLWDIQEQNTALQLIQKHRKP